MVYQLYLSVKAFQSIIKKVEFPLSRSLQMHGVERGEVGRGRRSEYSHNKGQLCGACPEEKAETEILS